MLQRQFYVMYAPVEGTSFVESFYDAHLFSLSNFSQQLMHFSLLYMHRIAECFSFLVCTKWSNPSIQHDGPPQLGPGGLPTFSSSPSLRPGTETTEDGSTSRSDDDDNGDNICGRQDIGGHLLKLPILLFQILLCMKLEVWSHIP